jgi:hypothetical protein
MKRIDSLSSGIPGTGTVVITTRPRSFVSSYSVPKVCLLTMSFQPFCEGKKYREYLPAGTKRSPIAILDFVRKIGASADAFGQTLPLVS